MSNESSPSLTDLTTAQRPESALLPDAPIIALLSLRHNPLVADMSGDQLRALVTTLRNNATSAPTLSAKLARDSEKIKPTRAKSKLKSILDDI